MTRKDKLRVRTRGLGSFAVVPANTMPAPCWIAWVLSMGTLVLGAGSAAGQNYPNKPIRMVAAEAGSGSELVARVIAQGLAAGLGQQVVVDNRGILAGAIVAKAPPDGYTLIAYGSPLWLAPFLQDTVAYDPVKDFAPISLTASTPNILVVHPSVPAKSVKELIALAKSKPGELNYGSGSKGSSTQIAAGLFEAMAGVRMMRVPYKGSGPALTALIGGQIQLMFPAASSVAPHLGSGRLRALAITSAQPSALGPGLPTVAASGLPGYESLSIYGMFAPAKTPAALIKRLNGEIVRVLSRADVKQKLFGSGVEAVGSTPEQLAQTVRSEMDRLGKVVKDAAIRAE